MISPETRAQIRRYFYAEHWEVGTIASELGVHPDAVLNAIESERFKNSKPLGVSIVDPYIEFIRHILDQHPRLRACACSPGNVWSCKNASRNCGRKRATVRRNCTTLPL